MHQIKEHTMHLPFMQQYLLTVGVKGKSKNDYLESIVYPHMMLTLAGVLLALVARPASIQRTHHASTIHATIPADCRS